MTSIARAEYDRLPYPTVIVVGGGFGGLEVVQRLNGKPFKVLLIDKQNHHCFQPLLYQVATASLSADSIAHPFRRTVAPMTNVAFRMAGVTGIDPVGKHVHTDRGSFGYDILILATGSTTNFFGNAAVEAEAMQLKSIAQALDIRSDFLQDFEAAIFSDDEAAQRRQLNFVIVGGGPTGVELAGAMAEIRMTVLKREYREVLSDRMQIHLIDSGVRLLKSFHPENSARAQRYLEKMGVHVRLGYRVLNFDGDRITLQDGSTIDTNTVMWAAGVKGSSVSGLGNALDERSGRFKVDAFNAVEGHKDIYAVGDIALMTAEAAWPSGHPQVAPAAIQQAQCLVKNLLARSAGGEMTPFTYFDKGSMATIGRYKAVVEVRSLRFGGAIAWLGWIFVHVMSLVSFRNRIMVLMNWAWKFMSWKNTIRLIIRPYVRHTQQGSPAKS
ncbi:MAG: NAD(P)/FAD-dependent oxidoreductase [Flavobacteriales bacterium]